MGVNISLTFSPSSFPFMLPPQARPYCPLIPSPIPSSFPHNPLSNIDSFWPFEQLGASALHRVPLSCLPQNCRPRTLGQPSVTPTKPAWSLRGRKMGVVLLDRSKPCRVDWPPQSGWQVAVSPLPTSPLTYTALLNLSTYRSSTTCPWTKAKASFPLPSQPASTHTSHPHPELKMLFTQWLSPLFLQAPPPSQTRGARPYGGCGERHLSGRERGTRSQMPSPLLLPTGKLWE